MRPEPRREAVFFAAGLLATAAQVLLLRELLVDVAGDEAAVGIGLAAWFGGVGAGAALARRFARSRSCRDGEALVGLLAVLPALALVGGRLLRAGLAPGAGELPGLTLTLVLALATLGPAGATVGGAFTLLATAASTARRPGEAVARLYVLEALGSLAGGLLVTLLVGRLVPLRIALLLGGAATLASLRPPLDRRRLAAALLCVGGLLASRRLDVWSEAVRFAGTSGGLELRAFADTPYQHLVVGGDAVRHLYASGQYLASFPDPFQAESLGQLVALLAPKTDRVLLLGGVERGLIPVWLRQPVGELTLLEPDAAALAFLEPQLPAADRAALHDPRVRLVSDDPRRWLASHPRETFDLVVLLGPDPATLGRARLATIEFFRLVAARLSPEGVLVTSLPSAPTVLTGETAALAGSLVRTLQAAFPVVRSTPEPDALALAGLSPGAVTLDPAVLAARWRRRGVRSPSFDAALLPVLLAPDAVERQRDMLAGAAAGAPLSRDDRPASFLHALARRQLALSGRAGRLVARVLAMPAGALALLAFLPAAWTAWRLRGAGADPAARAATHAVEVTGAAGLGWSLILLYSFQTRAGALYGELGALVAVFMAGVALGGALGQRALRAGRGPGSRPPRAAALLRDWLFAAALFAASLPLCLAAAARASSGGGFAALSAHGALLLAAGLVTGGLFPLAVEVRLAAGDGVADAAGRVETADHLGAAVSALGGSVLFVPLLGLELSALLLAGLLGVSAALAAWAERKSG